MVAIASRLLRFRGRKQRHCSLCGEQQERERLLQVQADGVISVAEITDGDVLTDVQIEIAATGSQHECAGNGGGLDDFIFHQPFDVLQHRVSVVAGFGECSIGIGAEQYGIGAVDTDEP